MGSVDFSKLTVGQRPSPFVQNALSCWSYDSSGSTQPAYDIRLTGPFTGYYCPAKTRILLPETVVTVDLKLVVPDTVRIQPLDMDMQPVGALVTVSAGTNPQTVQVPYAGNFRGIEIRCNDSATLQEVKW